MPNPREPATGIALLEITFALSLLALMATLGYVRLHSWNSERQWRQDADRALHAMQWARRRALTTGSCTELCLTTSGACLGPARQLQLRACGAAGGGHSFDLKASTAVWRGLRSRIGAGFDAEGAAVAVTGTLYLCSLGEQQITGRIVVSRSGRIRHSGVGGACPTPR